MGFFVYLAFLSNCCYLVGMPRDRVEGSSGMANRIVSFHYTLLGYGVMLSLPRKQGSRRILTMLPTLPTWPWPRREMGRRRPGPVQVGIEHRCPTQLPSGPSSERYAFTDRRFFDPRRPTCRTALRLPGNAASTLLGIGQHPMVPRRAPS